MFFWVSVSKIFQSPDLSGRNDIFDLTTNTHSFFSKWAEQKISYLRIIFQTSNAWRFSQTSKNHGRFSLYILDLYSPPSGCNYWQMESRLVWGISFSSLKMDLNVILVAIGIPGVWRFDMQVPSLQ